MSPEPEPPVHLTGREPPTPQVTPTGSDTSGAGMTHRRRVTRWSLIRLFVVGVSAAGVLVSAVLWATGHGVAGLRVLAGDVLALVMALLLST